MLQDRFRFQLALLALGDIVVVLSAYLLAFWLRASVSLPFLRETLPESRFFQVEHLFGLLVVSHLTLLYGFGLFDERLLSMDRGRLLRICAAAAGLQVLLLVGYRYFTTPLYLAQADSALYFPRSVYLVYFPLDSAGAFLSRSVFLWALRRRRGALRVAIVGTGPNAEELIAEIRRRPETGLELAGVFAEGLETPVYCGVPVLGVPADLVEVARRERVSEIIIANAGTGHHELLQTIARSELTGARVCIVPGFYELLIGKVHHLHVHDIPLVEVLRQPSSQPYRLLKRILDIGLAAGLLIVATPLAAVVAVLVRVGDGGPVFFAQERVGRDRKRFRLLKFRTMTPDAEKATGPVLSSPADQRVTRLGHWLRRYRVDEIPQLWNVLEGSMSLVGPRPERPFFVERFLSEIPGYGERFKVKPGVTGLAQVRGTYETSAQNKLRYDLAYIYNQSVWLDLAILLDTVKEVLNSRGY